MKKRATTTTTPPAREDSPSKGVPMAQEESASEMEKEEDDLESEFERAWEADFAGWNPFGKIKSRRVVDILHRLPLLREEALSMLRRMVSADPMMSAEKGQRVRRLQEDIARQKGEVLYFVRWVSPLLFLVFFFLFFFFQSWVELTFLKLCVSYLFAAHQLPSIDLQAGPSASRLARARVPALWTVEVSKGGGRAGADSQKGTAGCYPIQGED